MYWNVQIERIRCDQIFANIMDGFKHLINDTFKIECFDSEHALNADRLFFWLLVLGSTVN